MKKKAIRIVAFFVALISLFSLVACSSEQNGNETKAPANTTVPITTESVAPTQATTLPATTEAQTEPPETEPAVDISDVVWMKDNLSRVEYLVPKDWEREVEEDGSIIYTATQYSASIFTFITSMPDDFFDKYDQSCENLKEILHTGFKGYDIISSDSRTINERVWEGIRLENKETKQILDYNFHATKKGIFFILSIYSEDNDMLPIFFALQNKMIESVDFSSFFVSNLDPFTGDKTTFKDLHIGEIGKIKDIYVGLQYVKTMDYLPTVYGNATVSNDHEVILGFFEFLNRTEDLLSIDPNDIKCYADGILMSGVESYSQVIVDGVFQFNSEDIDSGGKLLSVQDFEVPKGWSEIKFFYNSECIWTITPKEASSKKYHAMTLFELENEFTLTQVNEVIYSDEYEVRFIGAEIYKDESFIRPSQNVVFKFRITNISESSLDFSHISSSMRAYQNLTFVGTPSLFVYDKIDNCISMSKVGTIEPGMSCDTYVAFEITEPKGLFILAYDDGGYWNNHLCGYVFVDLD